MSIASPVDGRRAGVFARLGRLPAPRLLVLGLAAAALAGWSVTLLAPPSGGALALCGGRVSLAGLWGAARLARATDGVWRPALAWAGMVAAMGAPLLLQPLRHLIARSFANRRTQAIALFVAGYGAVWMLVGPVLAVLALGLRLATPSAAWAFAVAAALAAIWQVSPAKQLCLNACHRRPALAAFGWPAARDAVRFGAASGSWCVGACWPLMLAALTAGPAHGLVMAAAAIFAAGERLEPPAPAAWRLRGPTRLGRLGRRVLRAAT